MGLKRGRFVGSNKILLILSILLIIAMLTKIYYDTNVFKVQQVQVNTDSIPIGLDLKIVQISDVHNKVFRDGNEQIIKAVQEAEADIIVLTGDLVDRKTKQFSDVFQLVEQLIAINPHTYFVTGNHEWGNPSILKLLEGLEERGVIILDNKNTTFTSNDTTINLVGIDNETTNHENMALAFNGVNSDNYTILLSHSPGIIEKYDSIPSDLVLSGHTHGGQVRFPFIGAIVAPDQGFFPKLDKGIYEFSEDQLLYIDSGLGTSVLPVRFWNQSQFSILHVTGRGDR